MKKILVLGAGYYYAQVLLKLKQAGFYVMAVDRDPNAPGAKFTHEFQPIDIIDSLTVLQWAKEKKIDGIMAVNDFGTRTASFVSNQLGLIGLSAETTEASNDKGIMRDVWQQYRLPIPRYRVIKSLNELKEALVQIGFPCVLKPTDCGGSGRGISVMQSEDDIEWSFNFAKPYVKNNRYIVEEYLDGTEMTIEAISIGGKVSVLAMSDKYKPNLRTRVATSLNYPANFSTEILQDVEKLAEQAVLAIGIENGVSHTEVIVTKEGAKLVEIGARGGGGHIFHTITEAVSEINAPVVNAMLLTGLSVDLPNPQKNGAVYRFFNPSPGILQEVKNIEEARQVKGVLDLGIIKSPGDTVGNLENSLHRAGFVVTCGKTRQEAIDIADRVESLVEFIVKPTA
jgi:formate-dependent phosphoribosylglycinamide formyltransferase (GAR transformylase)